MQTTHSRAAPQMPPRASSDGVSRGLGSEPRSLIGVPLCVQILDPNDRRSRAGGGEVGEGLKIVLNILIKQIFE